MPTQLQLRRGTTSQNNSFTGAAGELSVDTDLDQLRIHDGSTAGGTTVPSSGQAVGFAGNTAPATNTVTLGTPANVVIRTATGQSGNVIIGDATATTSHSLDVRGTANTGAITATTITLSADGGVLLPNDGNIGSAGSTAAMQISSGGIVTFADDIKIKDGGTIGTASDADAITIASAGAVTFSQRDVHSSGITIADGGQIGSASDSDSMAIAADGVVTFTQIPVMSAGINVSGGSIAGTLSTAAQGNITSLGTLTALTVDDVAINGKLITMTGSTDDTAVVTVGTNGTLTIETTDTAAAAGNIQITADGTAELAGTTVTLDSSGDIVLDADGADVIFKDGGTTILSFTNSSSDAVITSGVQDKDIIFKGDDGGSAITALTLDMSAAGAATFNGAITGGGLLTTGGNIVIPDAGTIGSASDTDAIAISSGGVVTMNQIPVFSAGINVSGGSIAGTLSTAAQTNITSVGTLSSLATSGDITVGDDIFLDSDSSVIHFGDDGDVTLTHVADTGLLLNSTMQLQFNDSSQFINAPSATVLDINATDEIELNATTIDVNGNLDVSGTIIDGDGGGTVPPGTVLPYTGSSAPTGFVLCDDSAISRTTFSVLFAIIGTSYGTGNGSTTFNVPDLRDRLPLGKGTNNSSLGAITAAAGASAVVATASGSASLTKSTGTFATSAKDSSTSSALTNVTSGGHTHNLTLPAQVFNYIIKT